MAALSWLVLVITVGVALTLAEVTRRLLRGRVGQRWPVTAAIGRHCIRPGFATAFIIGVIWGIPQQKLPSPVDALLPDLLSLAFIGAATWLILAAGYGATDIWLRELDESDRRTRRIRTQVALLRRVIVAVVVVIAAGAMLFTFDAVRQFGATLLASAGLIGIIIGIAARAVIGNLAAGLQLAFSDALRIDDVVVVEEEWGRVEELTLTYVVVRTWDERRLILPVEYFTSQPFENWTRYEGQVIGVLYLRVDWSVPVDELRAELHQFLQDNPLWDRREWVLQVTDVLDNGMLELRALMSGADSASAWDLKCEAREHVVSFLREKYPHALPRFHAELTSTAAANGQRSPELS